MKTIFSSIAIFIAAVAFAQSSQTRTVGDFNGVRASSPIALELTQGESNLVTVEGDENDLAKIKTEVKDNVLVITMEGNNSGEDVKVKVTVKKLNLLDVSGASATTSTNQLQSDSLTIIGSGASSVKLDVKSGAVKANLSGASSVKLSGTTSELEAVLSGASQLKAYQLQSDKAVITASGASSAHVNASTSIDANASGASEIHYQGSPADKKVNASGASSIGMRNGEENASDTTRIRMGGHDVIVTENEDHKDESSPREKKARDKDFEFWEGIDFGVDGYLTADNKVELPAGFEFLELNYAKSYVFGANLFQKNIHIYRNNVNLATGLGATWYHYNFRNSYSLTPNVSYATAVNDSLKYSKNRLNVAYVNVPLFLEFNTNNSDASHSFHFGAGMEFGYNIFNNKLKQKYEIDGHDYKRKQKDDFNVNPFRYDIIARIGYGNYTVFANYSLSSFFEKGKGPSVYPFSAGIHLSF